MKAILRFDLPEDKDEYDLAVNGHKYAGLLYEFDQEILRAETKYEAEISRRIAATTATMDVNETDPLNPVNRRYNEADKTGWLAAMDYARERLYEMAADFGVDIK